MSWRSLLKRLCARAAILAVCCTAAPALGQVQILSPADSTVSYRDRMAVIAVGLSGLPATLAVNGEDVQTLTARSDMKAEFLSVLLPPGPVVLRVSQTLPGGKVSADSVLVHVLGPVARLVLDVEPHALPADSLSQAEGRVRVLDQWGMPLPDGEVVTVHLDRGAILTEDLYPDQPGAQVQVRGGLAVFRVLSPASVGEGNLSATAGGVTAEFVLGYTQPDEEWTLAGMATGQMGWRRVGRLPAGVDAGPDFEEGFYKDGRAAFYARGTLREGYLLVMSFDSDRRYDDRVFRYLTPEAVYPIYGDASSIFYEAPSASRLFARLARDRSYIQYGDFSTGLSRQTELTTYSRSLTGISSQVFGERTMLTLFGASTDQAIQVDALRGEGISGYYYLSASRQGTPLVEGSERVVIQTRDRLHSEQVLKEETQYRFTDYEIDYEAGTLLFKRPVHSFGAEENPIFIVVTYEALRSLDRHWTGGSRLAFRPGDAWEVGVSAVGEERQGGAYWLTGLDMRWQPVRGTTLTSEFARSDARAEGWAWKLGAQGRAGSAFGYDLYYRDVDRAFDNPGSPTARPGVRKVQGRATWFPCRALKLTGKAYRTDDAVNNEDRLSAELGGSLNWLSLTNRASLEWTRVDRADGEVRSTILNAGAEWAVTRRLSLGAERDQVLGDEDLTYRPTLTRLRACWNLDERVDLLVEHAFRDGGFVDSSFTALGIQSRFTDDLTAYANYKLDGGISGRQNQAIVGLRHRYRPHRDVSFNTSFERVWALRGAGAGGFYAYSLAGEYLPPRNFRSSARFEQRKGQGLDKSVASVAADFTLARDLAWLTKYTYLDEGRSGERAVASLRNHHFLTGLAYRANRHDYINALGKYEYKRSSNSLVAPAETRFIHIGSFEAILEPRSQIEWFVRYAFKVSNLSSEGLRSQTLTDLWMTSLRLEWRRSWDVLGEYRLLTQHSVKDRKHGAALEAGCILKRNARLAAGYNFSGYQDRDLAGVDYWAHGPYIKAQVKFTEAGVAGWLGGLRGLWR